MRKILLLLLILFLMPVAHAGLFDTIKGKILGEFSGYECNIDVERDKRDRPECAKDSARIHACQIRGKYDGQGIIERIWH